MATKTVLIVDSEPLIRTFLKETLHTKHYHVEEASHGHLALQLLKEKTFDLIITDLKLPDTIGLELLKQIKEAAPQAIVIIITAYGTINNAVEAIKMGAYHYIVKPFSPDTLLAIIETASAQLFSTEKQYPFKASIPNMIIAHSPVMKKIIAELHKVAKSRANVFIHGESGTGKEVIAQAIHMHSLRAHKSYIRVNCAAIAETLLESEFFGHEKGSFTGANIKRLGRFELADGGTMLLDEVTEIPLMLQPKLLRVIQEQEFERVGGMKSLKVDVRLLSTSNRMLKEAISQKIFREDLYYRLNVIPIFLPPLRDRQEDIIPLAEYFLKKFCTEYQKQKKILSTQAQKKMRDYPWPGNIRQLINVIERTVVMQEGTHIEDTMLHLD